MQPFCSYYSMPQAQARDSLKQPTSFQFQNSTLTKVLVLTDVSVPHLGTWKRFPRPHHEVASSQVTCTSSKQPSSLLHESNELPSKKRLVSQAKSGSIILFAESDIQSFQEP